LRKAVGIIRNITDRRKAEEALRKSEERFDLTVRGSGDGLWDYDPATGELWYAERFRELLGYHGEEEYPNVVESWSNGLHPDDRRATLDAFGAHLARDVPYDVEYRLKTSSGEYRWFRARGISLRDETGRSHRAAGSITDIHEQKQAEKELREREERFSSLVANIPGVVYRCELDEHWTMSFMSDRIEEISGYPASDFIGNRVRSFGSIIHPDDIAHVEQMVSEGLRENRYYVIEYRIVHADGSARWVYEKGSAIDDGAYLDGVIFDVTERKRMEGALHEARQAAEAANEAKSAFLANMSHEIRTPMNGIIGMTELALDTDLTPEQREYLNTVQSSGDALLALINDILDFSKIEAGRIELDPDDFLLRDSISDTLSPLAMRAATKKLELAYDVHANVPDALVGDVYRLRQILVNLVGNAIKFTDEGEVVIEVGVAERQGDDVTLEIEVRDTGIGITPEAASRLFRAFEQAEISTTRKYGGTGLGLAISKQLVELMGGQIRLDSAPGEGSTFTFTVRFGVGKPRHSTTPRDAARVLNGKSVLIVDDNATNLRILTATVENWGLSSIQADSGAEALTQLDRASSAGQAISLVITDLHMPEIDGFDLVKSIRAHPSFSTLPVVLLSSSVSAGDKERCEELGIAARLLKPVKQSLLLDNIMRAIGSADHSEPMEAAEPTAESDAAQETSALRVLLAEDNPVNQKFAVRVLERAGHSVVVANNGREAVDRSATDRFDVILMDVQMPEMDGLEATRAIRTRESEHPEGLPIIAMTANAMAGDREMCLEAGMDGYVPKPVKRDVLFAEIDRVLKEVQRGTDV
jgi:two-component system sensor histidine kinase/response regulator